MTAAEKALWMMIRQTARCEHRERTIDPACDRCTRRDYDAALLVAERALEREGR